MRKNSLWINQILGEHKVGDRSKLNWEFHTILLMEVCQTEFKTFLEMKMVIIPSISAPDNHRYFQN
jgi:hypothetical protein